MFLNKIFFHWSAKIRLKINVLPGLPYNALPKFYKLMHEPRLEAIIEMMVASGSPVFSVPCWPGDFH